MIHSARFESLVYRVQPSCSETVKWIKTAEEPFEVSHCLPQVDEVEISKKIPA